MEPIPMLEFVGGLIAVPFFFSALYFLILSYKARIEKRGFFFALGLVVIVFSNFLIFIGDLERSGSMVVLGAGLFALAGIFLCISYYLSIKWLDSYPATEGAV
ncbi:MAG: hypothetical protein ACE5PM_06130 [Candidatus Hydrothermarchaeales archaeon]